MVSAIMLLVSLMGCIGHEEGEIKCINEDLYTFLDGQWTLTEKNCLSCGYNENREYMSFTLDTLDYITNFFDETKQCSIKVNTEPESNLTSEFFKELEANFAERYDDFCYIELNNSKYVTTGLYIDVQDEMVIVISNVRNACFSLKRSYYYASEERYAEGVQSINNANEFIETANSHIKYTTTIIDQIMDELGSK